MASGRITPVILSGGAGTRLWPMSTAERPKQMLPLLGEHTMLQLTALRVADAALFDRPVIVAGHGQADAIEAQLTAVSCDPQTLILEPIPRNTAPAIALAALAAEPEETLLVMPSDHVVGDESAFRSAIEAALPLSEQGWLVTFGIRPTHAETGYGYIKRGRELSPGVFEVEQFVEKPDRATAAGYLEQGCYDWNGGIFLFQAGSYLEALAQLAPDILAAAKSSIAAGGRQGARLSPDARSFEGCRAESIDYAVTEKADKVAVVPVEMGWSDLGSWDSLYEISGKDGDGNAIAGEVLAIGSDGCLLRSEGPMLVTIGVQDLVVIATGKAVLVVPRGSTQRVKEAVDALRATERSP